MPRNFLYFGASKISIPLLSPPRYSLARIYAHQKDLSPDIDPGPIFEILRYQYLFNFDKKYEKHFNRNLIKTSTSTYEFCEGDIYMFKAIHYYL